MDMNMDINQTTLSDVINEQLWCCSMEHMTIPTKVLIVTTKSNCNQAHKGVNKTLPALYHQHIDVLVDTMTLQCMADPAMP